MKDPINVEDFRTIAKRRLPRFVFDAIDGGAGDEVTLRENRRAFQHFNLCPRALADVTHRDLTTTVLGTAVSMPLLLAPTGAGRIIHGDAELIAARAAGRAGTIYALSSVARPPEDVAEAAEGPLWFQLYIQPTRDQTEEIVRRAEKAEYAALCVTIDGAIEAIRERDRRNGMKPPVKITARLLAQAASRPRWTFDFLRSGGSQMFGTRDARQKMKQMDPRDVERAIMNLWRPVTWDYLAWIRDLWPGRLLVKGVLRGDECQRLIETGVDGIVVSNHGGRQLDCVPGAIDVLPEVVQAVGGEAEVFVDGGVRRGSDVVKAVALGAKAVLIGRPYLYGLAANGEAGVSQVLEMFRTEIDNNMALLGCASVADIDASVVRRTSEGPASVGGYSQLGVG
jgi:isopentenyl diphosphate isomerase/L-lactate dehydrogenase-like FMN-dependent dehydrogenase